MTPLGMLNRLNIVELQPLILKEGALKNTARERLNESTGKQVLG